MVHLRPESVAVGKGIVGDGGFYPSPRVVSNIYLQPRVIAERFRYPIIVYLCLSVSICGYVFWGSFDHRWTQIDTAQHSRNQTVRVTALNRNFFEKMMEDNG